MIHKCSFLIILFLIVIGGIILFSSCHRHFGYDRFHKPSKKKIDWIFKRLSRELKLNDEQQVKMNLVKQEIIAKAEKFHASKIEIGEQVLTQLKSDTFDKEKMNQTFEAKELEMKEMRFFLVSKLAEIHEILEPDQRQKLAEKIEKFHKRFHKSK